MSRPVGGGARSGGTSRRNFLKTAATWGTGAPAFAEAAEGRAGGTVLAYVGSYTQPAGPDGMIGRGAGIYIFELNSETGALNLRELIKRNTNPSLMVYDTAGKYMYCVDWMPTYKGTHSGSVSAYRIERPSGHLTLLNTVSSHGANPTHLSLHPSGKFVLVASYFGGSVAVLPILPNGRLGEATFFSNDHGKVGPEHAASAPPGSFANSGHDAPHAHMIEADAAGRYVFSADLALDRILCWKFDAEKGRLSPNDPPFAQLPPGDGPRHFAFHPSGRWFYSLQEEGSTVVVFDYEAAHGRLTQKQTVSSLPKGFVGTNYPAEVLVSPDGRFLYASNRLHDTIARFSIAADGTLTWQGEDWTRGNHPRSFQWDPARKFFYVGNQFADAITVFRLDRETGAITFTGQYVPVPSPACVVFLTV